MRILTEDQYQRRIQEAEARGYERAKRESYQEREDHDFREGVWRDMRDIREEVRQRIERLEKATGNEYTPTCVCGEAVTCKSAPF